MFLPLQPVSEKYALNILKQIELNKKGPDKVKRYRSPAHTKIHY